MQYTSNYNLITVEGTDIVNPLVQMNPNFTDIDAAMFANKQSVIGTASEIVSGTVHAITRANTDSDYFRFTATGNWTLGDSMSVDGVTVSVFLSDGTLPGTGAYIINTEVLALLSGTRVTLLVSAGSVNAAAVSYDNTGSGLTATDVQDAIDEVAADVDTIDTKIVANEYGTAITIPNDGTMVTFPSDGYISVLAPYGSSNNTIYVKIFGATGTGSLEIHVQGNAGFTDSAMAFVRKGMRAQVATIVGTGSAAFVALA